MFAIDKYFDKMTGYYTIPVEDATSSTVLSQEILAKMMDGYGLTMVKWDADNDGFHYHLAKFKNDYYYRGISIYRPVFDSFKKYSSKDIEVLTVDQYIKLSKYVDAFLMKTTELQISKYKFWTIVWTYNGEEFRFVEVEDYCS